jgi:hypothetical protein
MSNIQIEKHKTIVILSGVFPYLKNFLIKAQIDKIIGDENIVDHIDKALELANRYLEK